MKHLFTLLLAFPLLAAGCALPGGNQPAPATPEEDTTVRIQQVQQGLARGAYVTANEVVGERPGILLIHEWWGLNDQIMDEAKRLAHEGYAVFAVDLYGESTTDATRARELSSAVRDNPVQAEERLKAALNYLDAQSEVADGRLATMGWCFGGGMSGVIGSTGDERIRATVIYYGTPVTDTERLANMTQPVLGIWGADDTSIPQDQVNAFEQALASQGTPVEFHTYDGAGHAFANPTRGDAYRPEATADAWEKTLSFLQENL